MGVNDDTQGMVEELVALRARLADLERRLGARSVDEEALPAGEVEVLVCRVGSERVALLLRDVREVVPIASVTALPEAPPWVLGLLQVGETAVPVLDVDARFDRRARPIAISDLVVLCRHEPDGVGLVVSEVDDVKRIASVDIADPKRDVPHAAYLRGTFRDADGAVLLLGLRRFVELAGVPGLDPTPGAP